MMKRLLLSAAVFLGLMTPGLAASPASPAPPALTQLGAWATLVSQSNQSTLPNKGRVSEALPAGKYLYLHVTNDDKSVWLALPRRQVPVGATVRYGDGMLMKDFRSSSLKRIFEEVYFVTSIEVDGEIKTPGGAGHPPIPNRKSNPKKADLSNSGTVNETYAASGYTYLHVTNGGETTWLAIPRRDIPVGATVRYGKGAVMKDFHSSSLNRTFDEVLFLNGVKLDGNQTRSP